MNQLYPIIRRVRRPLVPVDETAAACGAGDAPVLIVTCPQSVRHPIVTVQVLSVLAQ